ncbi:312_t:CDS:2 [Paraglomus occultum]|uniref:312_t:CDS:1 n=1 Tax=Paraglomus occultum TaxID=144539 RepID=A0A9N8WRL5_9GLOM|nr:312_t:CDS:2 [Paraglomus occultum]
MRIQKSTTDNSPVSKNQMFAPHAHAQPTALPIPEPVLPLPQPFINYFEPVHSIYPSPYDMMDNRMGGTAFDNKIINCYRCAHCTWGQPQSGGMTSTQNTDTIVSPYPSSATTSPFACLPPLFTHQSTSQSNLPSPPIFDQYTPNPSLLLSPIARVDCSPSNEDRTHKIDEIKGHENVSYHENVLEYPSLLAIDGNH